MPERYRLVYSLNPMVGIIEAYRDLLLRARMPDHNFAMAAAIAVLLCAVGTLSSRVSKTVSQTWCEGARENPGDGGDAWGRRRQDMTAEEPADDAIGRYLDWDSGFFGFRIGRAVPNTLRPDTVVRLLAWCASQRIDCLCMLTDAGDSGTIRVAEDNAFRCVDIRVTLAANAHDPGSGTAAYDGTVRRAAPGDVAALRAMARTGFRLSRFYADPAFPRAAVDALYETWIEKSCHGYADAVLVADSGGHVVGYVTCHRDGGARGRIGLLGSGTTGRAGGSVAS